MALASSSRAVSFAQSTQQEQTLEVRRVSEQDSGMRILLTNPTLPLPNELIIGKVIFVTILTLIS